VTPKFIATIHGGIPDFDNVRNVKPEYGRDTPVISASQANLRHMRCYAIGNTATNGILKTMR